MPRSDDYQTNDEGHISRYDIIIDDIGLAFYGDTPVTGSFGPAEDDEKTGKTEVGLIFNDFSNGMGMGYSGIPNTYAFTIDGYARTPRKYIHAGLRTEIDLTGILDATAREGEIRCAEEDQYGNVYIGAGSHILKIDANAWTGNTAVLTEEYNVGTGSQLEDAVRYNGILLFSTDQSFASWQYLTALDPLSGLWITANSNGTNPDYQVNTGADNYELFAKPVYLQHMVKVFQEVDGVGGNRLVGNDSLFTYTQVQATLYSDIIGNTDVYGASLSCGDTSYSITNIAETNHIFFITKADGVYGIESSGIYCPNYTPDLKKNVSLDNGLVADYFAGKLFVGTPQGLLMVDVNNKQLQDVPIYVSPSFYFANETPVFGTPTASTNDNGWLVVALYNGVDSHICYTRPRENTLATIPNPMIWHGSECTIPGERITMLFKTSAAGYPRILIGTHDGTHMHLYVLSIPKEGDPYTDYLHGGYHEFATEAKLFLPFQDADDPNAKKVIRRFDTQVDGLTINTIDPDTGEITATTSAGEINFYANANAGSRIFFESVDPGSTTSEWDFQGVISDSPRATMIPSTPVTSGYQIGILLWSTLTNLAASISDPAVYAPFAIRSVKIRTEVNIEQIEEKVYTVTLGEFKEFNDGSRETSDTELKLLSLTSLQDEDGVYMINEWNSRVLVKVQPGMQYKLRRMGNDQRATWYVIMNVHVSLLGQQFYWDRNQPYDSVYAWGP